MKCLQVLCGNISMILCRWQQKNLYQKDQVTVKKETTVDDEPCTKNCQEKNTNCGKNGEKLKMLIGVEVQKTSE